MMASQLGTRVASLVLVVVARGGLMIITEVKIPVHIFWATFVGLIIGLITASVVRAEDRSSCPTDKQYQDFKANCGISNSKTITDDQINCVAKVRQATCGGVSGTEDSCKSEITDMNKAKSDFLDSCGDTLPACIDQAVGCEKNQLPTSDDSTDATPQRGEDRLKISSSTQAQIDKMLRCPHIAKANRDKYKDLADKGEEKLNKLNDRLRDATTKANQLQGDISHITDTLKVQVTAIDNKEQDELANLKDLMSENQKKALSASSDANDAITGLLENERQAYSKKVNQLNELDNACYKYAIDLLQKFLSERNALLSASSLSAGDFSGLMSTVGQTRGQKNQDYALKYYNACMTTPPHTTKVAGILDDFQQAITQIHNRINSVQTKQKSLIDSVYGTDASNKQQSDAAKIVKKYEAEKVAAQTDAKSQMDSKNTELNALVGSSKNNQCATGAAANANCLLGIFGTKNARAKADSAGVTGEIGELQLEVTAAKKEHDANLALFKHADDISRGVSNDKASNFSNKFSDYIDKAAAFASTTECCSTGKNIGECKTATDNATKATRLEVSDKVDTTPETAKDREKAKAGKSGGDSTTVQK